MLTNKTPEEIAERFKEIVENKKGIASVEQLLDEYPLVPLYVKPYLQSIYFKDNEDFTMAAAYMDDAISLLKAESVSSRTGKLNDAAVYMFVYNPFEKELWGQAGEIFANVNRYDDSLDAYKLYQRQHCCIKADDVSSGLLSFRPMSKYALCDLINNEITVCKPREMNDPFDTLLLKWGEHKLDSKKDRKHIPPFVKSLDYFRIRAFCRINSQKGKNRILKNVLMWSHYADKHMGMCIEYQFSSTFAKTENSTGVCRFRNVIYRSDRDRLSVEAGAINTDVSLLTKHASWRYENEVRLITYLPNQEGSFVHLKLDDGSRIKNIYFGMRCPEHDIMLVKNIISSAGMNVGFFRMKPNYSDIFHLLIEPI